MDEITIDDKTYISSKRAAAITGYAKDYVGQLCREGRVEARLIGRSWYVLEDSIRKHRFDTEEEKTESAQMEDTGSDASEKTRNEAVWEKAVYIPEEVEMLPVKERESEEEPTPSEEEPALADSDPMLEEKSIESEAEHPVQITTLVEGSIQEEAFLDDADKEEQRVEEESQAAWESWFSNSQTEPASEAQEEPKAREGSYTAPREEFEPVQVTRVHKSVTFDIGAPESLEESRLTERPVRAKSNYLILKALIIAVIVLFVSLAIIGSGVPEALGSNSSWGIINVLGGTSIIK